MYKRMIFIFAVILFGSASLSPVFGGVPDVIAWWNCDEGSGNTVGDASGNGHDGTFVNGASAWGPGNRGSAIVLVGPTVVEVPPINMVLTQATMAGWIKPNGPQPDWSSFIMTRTPGLATGFNILGYQLAYHWNDTSNSWSYRGGDMIAADDWTFAAVTIEPDKATFYVNGVQGSVNRITHGPCTWNSNIYLGGDGNSNWVARRMNGSLDDVSLFSRALSPEEILIIMEGFGAYPTASNPIPADGALHADTWVNLSWRAGDFAVSHDVYLGDNFADVDAGAGDTFRGNQTATFYVAGFPGFAYPDGLVPGTTYYWRIDEVNDAEPNSPWKGDIWSFSIPPKKAYNPNPADGTEGVLVNSTLSWTGGFGAKLHYVYFGETYDQVANATGGLPQGTTTYSPKALQMAKTYYWRVDEFDAVTTHKGDVWSFTTEGAVGGANPANGAVDVQAAPVLTWNASPLAASHEVYFGSDADAVRNATKASPEYKGSQLLGNESYDPGTLLFNTSYYWRIDEINSANSSSPWVGNVWSFTTGSYFVVDDFESYNDIEPPDPASNRIFDNWIDGFGTSNNGALVGNDMPPYAEQTIVNGGAQSMPYRYDNNGKSSEAVLTLVSPRNWTEQGVSELSLWFRGNPASVGSFVEGPAGTYTMTGAGADIWNQADEFHYAYKTLNGIGSIEARVESVQNTNAWAKAGVMIRETLDPGSKFAAVYITPTAANGSATNGCRFQARTDTGAAATSDSGVVSAQQTAVIAPYWVKIERDMSGNFRGYYSSNGTTWQAMTWNPQYISMSANVYVGLALTSHSAGVTCQAKFSGVKTTGTVGPQWSHQDIGIASNAAEPLYVAVSNNAGSPAVIYHDDANAATIVDWTQWIIPLQAFADKGINLANVNSIAIGMGTKGNTGPGGTGQMYFDDIRLYKP